MISRTTAAQLAGFERFVKLQTTKMSPAQWAVVEAAFRAGWRAYHRAHRGRKHARAEKQAS